jgi:DNA-binding transcriptional ArsR family regulator
VSDAGEGPLDRLFGALADPTRRALLQRLVQHGPDTATRLVEQFSISRQAVVKHLQALADAGLVTSERDGREVRYRATPDRLRDAVTWMLDTGANWDRRADRLSKLASGRAGELRR